MTQYHQEIVEFLQQLIAIPSFESERALAKRIFTQLSSFGFSPELIGHENRPSIICTANKVNSNKTIWFDSHLDTAPIGDAAQWHYPPLAGQIVGNRMYGRGVADAKAAIAIFCYLALDLIKDPTFKGDIFLSFDAEEENGKFTGIKKLTKYAPHVDACILGYQGADEISIGARGWLRLKLTTFGKSAHTGSRLKKGINAVHAMIEAASNILSLDLDVKTEPFFDFGSALNICQLRGGEAINVVPHQCEAYLDIRLIPLQNKDDIISQIQKKLESIKQEKAEFSYQLEILQDEPAYLTNPQYEFIQILHNKATKILDRDIPLVASGPGSVGNFISRLGVPIVNSFGCESGNVHAPNEWLNISMIPQIFRIYKESLIEFCH